MRQNSVDKVDHRILLNKLNSLRCQGNAQK